MLFRKIYRYVAVMTALPHAILANPEFCVEDDTGYVECRFTVNGASFQIPPSYTNMTLQVYGASGGAALDRYNVPNAATRGLGVYLRAKWKDDLPQANFSIYVPLNGADARVDGPGVNAPRAFEDQPGNGGYCPSASNARYGAAGGTSAGFYRSPMPGSKKQMIVWLGAGGGSGAYDPYSDMIPHGGHAAAIAVARKGSGALVGEPGSPKHLSGTGGSRVAPGKGGRGYFGKSGSSGAHTFSNAGNGGNGFNSTDFQYCLSGGGGGSGNAAGGGGGAVGNNKGFGRSAGSGGAGNSFILQEDVWLYDIVQVQQYTPDPLVIISYNKAKSSCLGGFCTIMRKKRQ